RGAARGSRRDLPRAGNRRIRPRRRNRRAGSRRLLLMEFGVLGPVEAREGDVLLPHGRAKQPALLAIRPTKANRVGSGDRLSDAPWEDEPPATAQKALQVHVSQLRKLLGKERLQTEAPGYLLRVEPDEFDLARFQRMQEEGRLH